METFLLKDTIFIGGILRRIIIEEDYKEMSSKAAFFIGEAIKEKPNLILGLATGSTPIGTYEELIRMHKEERLDFSKVTTFNLDDTMVYLRRWTKL